MKKQWKRAVSIGCAACMLASTMPVTGFNLVAEAQGIETQSDEAATSGTWGTCEWNLDEDGVLTISGGVAESLRYEDVPWIDIREDIEKVNITGNITFDKEGISLNGLFWRCENLTEIQGLENLDTSQVTNMSEMFLGCSGLKDLDVSGFDTSQVTSMSEMFLGCSGLKELDVSGFDTSQVTSMSYMFGGCKLLKQIDMGNWDISKLESWDTMFSRSTINCIILPSVLPSKAEWLDALSWWLSSGYWQDVTDDVIYTNETDIVWKAGHKYILKSVSSKQDSVTGITIKKQDDSMMDADIELKVSDVTANEDYTDYIQVVDKLGKTNCLFDIALEKDGTAIQPDGTVLVSIPLPDGMSETAKVYRIAEDGTATDMNEAFADGYLTFATDHFSVYAVVDENAVLGDVNGDGKFNMADAALVRRYVANMDVSVDTSAADVNKDGKIDMVDYALMRRALANWDVELK